MAQTQVTVIVGLGISMTLTYDSLSNVLSGVRFTAANVLSNFTANVWDVDTTVLANAVPVTAVAHLDVTPSGSAVAVFHPYFRQFWPRSTATITVSGSERTVSMSLA